MFKSRVSDNINISEEQKRYIMWQVPKGFWNYHTFFQNITTWLG